jgi:hypothetical protein
VLPQRRNGGCQRKPLAVSRSLLGLGQAHNPLVPGSNPGGPIRETDLRGSYEFDGHAGTIAAGSERPPLLPRRGAYLVSPFQWCAPRSVPELRIQVPEGLTLPENWPRFDDDARGDRTPNRQEWEEA